MKKDNGKKNAKKNTKSPKGAKDITFYVATWACCDSEGYFSHGTLTDIFATKESAHKAIMDSIRADVEESVNCYDQAEWESVYGADTIDGIVDKFICSELDTFITARDPSTDMEFQYGIVKYSTKYIK